jgi:hypothetical protein
VQKRLSAVAGRDVRAWSVLVVMGCEVEVRKPPANLTLLGARSVSRWLQQLPSGALTPGEVLELERLARTPGTWLPAEDAVQPRPRRPARAEPSPQPPDAPAAGPGDVGQVTVRRWKRYDKDRLYANGADGLRLGYLEVATGEIVLEVADPAGTIAEQLRASHREIGQPPTGERTAGGT